MVAAFVRRPGYRHHTHRRLVGPLAGDRAQEGRIRQPGTKNALRLGGPALAAAVLLVEVSKGVVALWLGTMLAGQAGAVAGIGATLGNV